MTAALRAVGGAFEFATVAPIPARMTRSLSGPVLSALPVVGAALGGLAAAVAWLASLIFPAPLAGLAALTAVVLATRGLHLDGLSDTVDALGCYGPPERALAVMRDGPAGPFGVAAIVITVGAQSLSFGVLISAHAWTAIATAVAAGRVGAVLACCRGITAADSRGFGARVAGSQPRWLVAAWCIVIGAAAAFARPERMWQGPVVVLAALVISILSVRHCVRRFGGITGDVLGATVELTTTLTVLGLAAQ